jgi:hypothetical protein
VFSDVAKAADLGSVADSRVVTHHNVVPYDNPPAKRNVLPYQDPLTLSCDFQAEKLLANCYWGATFK